jgi:cytoskeletal protein CcmA (bactofilin family)
MGLFGKSGSAYGQAQGGDLNAFLGAGTEYRGRLEFVGTVRIDGMFHGEIVTEGSLILGREAVIRGRLNVGRLFSNGEVEGDVFVRGKAVLQKHAVLRGSLSTPALVVEEGAVIEGDLQMTALEDVRVAGASARPVDEEPTAGMTAAAFVTPDDADGPDAPDAHAAEEADEATV